MLRLLQFPLDPFCRRTRLTLAELGHPVELQEERPWETPPHLFEINPAGTLPVLMDADQPVACGVEAVTGYIEEVLAGRQRSFLGQSASQRAEVRRLVAWFDNKFHHEVTSPLLKQKIVRRFLTAQQGGGAPNMNRVRAALGALKSHIGYVNMLAEARNLLAGDMLSAADLAAAAHISTVEYLASIDWQDAPFAKAWYQRVKSRPSFRSLLADQVRGVQPSQLYAELDF